MGNNVLLLNGYWKERKSVIIELTRIWNTICSRSRWWFHVTSCEHKHSGIEATRKHVHGRYISVERINLIPCVRSVKNAACYLLLEPTNFWFVARKDSVSRRTLSIEMDERLVASEVERIQ